MAVEKLNIHKSPGIDQIPAELTKAGGRTVRSEIHKLNNLIWNKEELCEDWKESIIVPIYKKGDKLQFTDALPLVLSTPVGMQIHTQKWGH